MLCSEGGFDVIGRTRLAIVLFLLASALPAPASAQVTITSCSTPAKNVRVHDILNEFYLWYSELPTLDPARFRSPEEYLEAVRYRPLDSHFSYITSRESNEAFFGESQYVGLGFSQAAVGREIRILQVFPDSPASQAGLERGHRITQIGGRPVEQLIDSDGVADALGPPEPGVTVQIQFADARGALHTEMMTKAVVTIPTVSLTQVYNVAGRRVGYFHFRNFVTPSFDALDAAFNELRAARANELVLDLRYNGGGLVRVAQHLASLIGGERTNGQVLAEYFHNAKQAFRNQIIRFEGKPNALMLDRLVVITTPASASASELIINALRPFIPVVVIGDRTYGKPVGQYQFEFCDKMFAPVSFSLRNANGEGDFFGGFPPDCAAPDDADHALGDPAEGSLREALTFISTGACSPPAPGLQHLRPARRAPRATGWQSVVNAY
jgi:carboxyl-terminal processing protease